jgi:excisionase family DNA binding protein
VPAGDRTGTVCDTRRAMLLGMSTQTPTRDGTVLLTPADAARVANVSRDTIYREIERGALPVRHVGRQLRIDPLDFRHYLERGTEA